MTSWTWRRIVDEWLGQSRIALPRRTVMAAFERVESLLGTGWLESAHRPGQTGAGPALHVASVGLLLEALEDLPGHEALLGDVRAGKRDSWAELEAIYLVARAAPYVLVRVRPLVLVTGPHRTRNRIPDFRVRDGAGPWLYVEVANPEESLVEQRIDHKVQRLAGIIDSLEGRYALELFLRREPTDDECRSMAERVRDLVGLGAPYEEEMPGDLGRIFLNKQPAGSFTAEDHGEPDQGPRRGIIRFIGTRVGEGRSVAVRMPYTDDRADRFLRREARQLPADGPGLLMFALHGGQIGEWQKLIRRRFEAPRHRRVSGVCLFTFGLWPTPAGEEWRPQVRLIRNPHAHVPLPLWAQGFKGLESRDDPRSRLLRPSPKFS